MNYELADKVVLVTGGARGIGLAVAQSAHSRGAKIVLIDLDEEVAAESAATLGSRAIGIGADVTSFEQVETAFERAISEFGRVDVVVANAGIAPSVATVAGMPVDEWERVVQVNLYGVWHTVRAGMEQIVDNQGQFVLVSSSYAYMNGMLNTPYATAKAGVEALGRSIRTELLPHGASATVAYFGFIRTNMVGTAFEDPLVNRIRAIIPSFLTRQIPVFRAGEKVVEAIEKRAPRVIVPFEYKAIFYLRGLLLPLMDRRFATDERIAAVVRDSERRS